MSRRSQAPARGAATSQPLINPTSGGLSIPDLVAQLRPFHAGEFVPNDDGTVSTERTATIDGPDGGFMNVPTLWKRADGMTVDLGKVPPATLGVVAASYARRSGEAFPTFPTVKEAVGAAKRRSANGGAFQDPAAADAAAQNAVSGNLIRPVARANPMAGNLLRSAP